MSDGVVAAQATEFPARGGMVSGVYGLHNVTVASAAGVLGYIATGRSDLDVVWKVSSGKKQRMEESIAGLDGVFARQVMGRVTIIAGGSMFMTPFDPAIVLRIHYMAVCAGLRIIG